MKQKCPYCLGTGIEGIRRTKPNITLNVKEEVTLKDFFFMVPFIILVIAALTLFVLILWHNWRFGLMFGGVVIFLIWLVVSANYFTKQNRTGMKIN